MIDIDNIITKIEKEKEDRSKCIFFWKLTLTTEEKIKLRKGLKQLINEINKTEKDFVENL